MGILLGCIFKKNQIKMYEQKHSKSNKIIDSVLGVYL